MKNLDPNKTRIIVVAFGDASNVHKAADLIKEHFPAITVVLGMDVVGCIGLGRIKIFVSLLRRYVISSINICVSIDLTVSSSSITAM